MPDTAKTDLLTVSEAAEILRVAPETVRRRVRDGSLPACRLGTRSIRIRSTDVQGLATPAAAPDALEARIARLIADAPPLTDDQCSRIAMLVRRGGDAV